MNRRTLKVWLLAALAALLLAALAAAPLASRAGSAPPTPAAAVQQAWQRAHDLGAYRFTTDLTATAYPAPALANVGRPAREERLHLEGNVDLPARTLLLSLWQGAGSVLNPGDGAEVRVGEWQHLAVVWSGNTARFFLNGHPTNSLTIGTHSNVGNVAVGYDAATAGSRWDGRIDEVAIYDRALSDTEVESLWLYQGQWVQEMHTTQVSIDNDKPTSDLVSDSPYRPNRPVELLIQTSDATSPVAGAQWQVDSGAWTDAPPCDGNLGVAWCPTFDPAAFHGEGKYVLHTRATDAAGNVSDTSGPLSADPLYVDGTAPTVTTTSPQDEALVKLTPVPGVAGAWSLSIAGTVTEPEVATGVPGSGLRSVKVTLLDGYRRPAGDGTQLAEVSGTARTAEVTLTDPNAGGAYIIQVEAEDQMGNAGIADTATIYLDQTAPEASLSGLPVGGVILALRLDETTGATRFADSSGYYHDAVCGATCPTAGVTGKYGKAVELNGTSQSLAVSDALDFGPGDFTIAAWFQTTGQSWQTIAAASTTGSPAQDVLLLQVTNGGKVRFAFAPDAAVTNLTSPHAIHDGQWHQAAAVRRGSELLLYVDGEIVATKTDSRALSGPLRLALGQHSGAEFFKGRLDEVYVVPVALTSSEMHDLLAFEDPAEYAGISGVVSEIPLIDGAVMDLHLEESSGERFADGSADANDAACSGTSCPVRVTTGTFAQCDMAYTGTLAQLTVYDASGNRTTKSAAPMAAAAGAPPPEDRPDGILILEPPPDAILSNTAPVTIAGSARSAAWLRRLEVRVDGAAIYAVQWRKLERTGTPWSTTWMPSGEGAHAIEAWLTDWAGRVFTGTATVTLDQTAPAIAVATTVLTTTHLAGGRVTPSGTASDAVGLAAALTHFYGWPSLGAGVCPNGTRMLAAGQAPYPDADLQVRLTADPAGIVYHYLGDHLFPWARYLLLGGKPADFSGLLSFLDRDHPFVHDGQALRYTLHFRNSGREMARGLAARLWASNALTLPGGAPLAGSDHRYYQQIPVGDLAPGEARTVSFEGRVNLAWAQPLYEQCLLAQPDRPRLCEQYLHWALLKVEIVDQTYTVASGPLERLWADHRVDFSAPRFVGISRPGRYISAGGVALRGYAYDDSGVPKLSLRVQTPAGGTVSLPCPNPAPDSGAWSCAWDATAANGGLPPQDGQTFRVRLRGTDGAGLTGDLGPWQPFIVDTVPPTVTAQLVTAAAVTGLPASVRTLQLSGRVADNHGAAGVEVCLEGECDSALVALEGPPRLKGYADQPGEPVPLAACGSGEVRRTFAITDTFALGTVSLGLRAEHPDRDQIRAELVSPAGTHARVLSGEGELGSDYQNYTVLLADAAGGAVSRPGRDHDPAAAGFPHLARPDDPLSAFIGERAAGTWILVLCDTDPAGDAGSYLGSELLLQPQDTGAPQGTWSQRVALPELDGVEQTVTVYGLDDAGNRTTEPFTHIFVVDNVPPQIGITRAISEVQMAPDLAPMGVLTGTVADGDRVRRLFAVVYTPDGQLHLQPVARDGEGWSFALRATTAGVHTIRIVAEDLAGNQTTIGPALVEVHGILVVEQVHLPVMLRNAMGGVVQERLWLPLVIKGLGEAEVPEAPELPAPSATVAITPTLTLTPTVTMTTTVRPTVTLTVTPTGTVTPTTTATITPTATGTP